MHLIQDIIKCSAGNNLKNLKHQKMLFRFSLFTLKDKDKKFIHPAA